VLSLKGSWEHKKSELNVFCQKMKELVDSQTRNTMDSGLFAVAPEYVHEKENPKKWVKRSKVYMERAINCIHKICMLSVSETVSKHPVSCLADVQTSSNTKTVSENVPPLSVSWKNIGLPKEVFSGMWSKASELVAKAANITDAPGLPNSKMVVSLTSPQKPHLVTTFSNGKVTCDCLNYSTKSLCAHILATAQKPGVLQSLLDWYKATNKQPNLWSLARSSGVTKHPGDKPHTAKRKRSRVSRPPPETCSALQPAASAITPGNSPNPKQTSLQSISVSASQSVTNLSISPLNSQNSSLLIQKVGMPTHMGIAITQLIHLTVHITQLIHLIVRIHTILQCTHSHLSYLLLSQTPPYMTPHPEPTTKDPSPGPFTLKFINNRISKCQGCKG